MNYNNINNGIRTRYTGGIIIGDDLGDRSPTFGVFFSFLLLMDIDNIFERLTRKPRKLDLGVFRYKKDKRVTLFIVLN